MEQYFTEAVLPWLKRYQFKQATVERLIDDLEREFISMPVYIAERIAACGYGMKLLPILKSERLLHKNFRHEHRIEQLVEQIETANQL